MEDEVCQQAADTNRQRDTDVIYTSRLTLASFVRGRRKQWALLLLLISRHPSLPIYLTFRFMIKTSAKHK
jgi:hypothetical protein